jgi:uncharacterized protein
VRRRLQRALCTSGYTPAPIPNPKNDPRDARQQPRTQVAPSFDCRFAASSIERAICSDDELAEWDARMGQALQQALRLRKDSQAVLDGQRRWIIQRNRACGSAAEIPFSCLLAMTKQRLSALSEDVAAATSIAPQPQAFSEAPQAAPTQSAPTEPNPLPTISRAATTQPESDPKAASSNLNTGAIPQAVPKTHDVPASTSGEQGYSPLILLIGLGIALWLGGKVVRDIRRRQALLRRRQSLIARFGEEAADRILAGEVWQGMTNEQLVESWGDPVEVGREVVRNKTKETWKYVQTGRNRFANRVYLENGSVIGWKV